MDIEGGSLSDKAYAKVRDMVVNRQLTGGDILVESRLAETLDLTRTPLREALVRLEGAGLLIKKKGTFICCTASQRCRIFSKPENSSVSGIQGSCSRR